MSDYRTSHLSKGNEYDHLLAEEAFASYASDREADLLRSLIRELYPSGVKRSLDFACGTGRITSVTEPLVGRSYGIDVSADMIARARARCPATEFHLVDLTTERPPIEPVDLITSFRFLGNAQDELRVKALRALRELLTPGGYLIVNDHRNPWALHRLFAGGGARTGRLDLSLPKLTRLLRDTGFDVEETRCVGAWYVRRRMDDLIRRHSPLLRPLEILSDFPLLRPFCPDILVAARAR